MSDEAVVRVVIMDGGSSTRSVPSSQSSSAGMSQSAGSTTSAGSSIANDRLYREMTKSVVETTKGFKTAIDPVVGVLKEVLDNLKQGYTLSINTQKDLVTQIIARPNKEVITNPVKVDTDRKMIDALNSIVNNTQGSTGITKDLFTKQQKTIKIGAAKKPSWLGWIFEEIKVNLFGGKRAPIQTVEIKEKSIVDYVADINKDIKLLATESTLSKIVPIKIDEKIPAVAEEVAKTVATDEAADKPTKDELPRKEATHQEVVEGLLKDIRSGTDQILLVKEQFVLLNTKTASADVADEIVDTTAGKDEPAHEEATNQGVIEELLRGIQIGTDQISLVKEELVSLNVKVADILGRMPIQPTQEETVDEGPSGGGTKTTLGIGGPKTAWDSDIPMAEPLELGDITKKPKRLEKEQEPQIAGHLTDQSEPPRLGQELPNTRIDPPPPKLENVPDTRVDQPPPAPEPELTIAAFTTVPDTRIDQPPPAPEIEDLGEGLLLGQPEGAPVNPDPWDNWQQPHHGRGWNTSNVNKQEMIDSGFQRWGPGQISDPEYQAYVVYRQAQAPGTPGYGPPGFARGGAVGTDTIPAMLSPGEVVVPKHMVDGGAVDHLKGKLPGFADGGKVEDGGASDEKRSWRGWAADTGKGAAGALWEARRQAQGIATDANDDPAATMGKLGGAVSAVGDKLMAANPVIGGFVKGIGMAGEALGALMSAINETANRYGEYSPEIAQAQAIAEVNHTMGDMRRAQEVGNELAHFVVSQGEMQQKFEDIKVKLLMQITPTITQILEVISDLMGSGEGIESAISALLNPMNSLAATADQLNNNQQADRMLDPSDALLDDRMMRQQGPRNRGFAPNE